MTSNRRRPAHPAPAQEIVRSFYDRYGWRSDGAMSGEDKLFRQFPHAHQTYARGPAARVLRLLAPIGGRLLLVGGGDLPQSHVEICAAFERAHCLDISAPAVEQAKAILGDRAVCQVGSIVDSGLESATFDAVFCAHVAYHIDRSDQERAVREMLRLVKPGGRVVIIYANPRSPFAIPGEAMRRLNAGWTRRPSGTELAEAPPLYYYAHPLSWWRRFADPDVGVRFEPWEAIGSRPARALLKSGALARAFYRAAAALESAAPSLAVALWQYPIVVIDKRR